MNNLVISTMPDKIIIDLGSLYRELVQEMQNCILVDDHGEEKHYIAHTISTEEVLNHLVEFARIRMTENYIRRMIEKLYGARFQDRGTRLATISVAVVADLWVTFKTMQLNDELDDILPYRYRSMMGSTSIILQYVPREFNREHQALKQSDSEAGGASQIETRACHL